MGSFSILADLFIEIAEHLYDDVFVVTVELEIEVASFLSVELVDVSIGLLE
jgi:hypothetical protein